MASFILASLALLAPVVAASNYTSQEADPLAEPGRDHDQASPEAPQDPDDPEEPEDGAEETPEETPEEELAEAILVNDAVTHGQPASGPDQASQSAPAWLWPAAFGLTMVSMAGAWTVNRSRGAAIPEVRRRLDGPPDGPDPVERPGAEGMLLLGGQAVENNQLEEAIAWFEGAALLDPRLPVAHLLAGLCLQELDRHEHAIEALHAALNLDPGYGEAAYAKAESLVHLDRHAVALDLLEPLASENPEIRDLLAEDPAFRELHDHPRFIHLVGRGHEVGEDREEMVWFEEA